MKRLVLVLVAAGIAATLFYVTFGQRSRLEPQELTTVFVSNFPVMQEVTGKVDVKEPIPVAKQLAFREKLVPPVPRRQTTRYIDLGTIEASGFRSVVVSLHGSTRGQVTKPGDIGVILLPEEPSIIEAFDQVGFLHFGLETIAEDVTTKTPFFASTQDRFDLGFETYRVLLYNDTDKTVRVDLFTYLTN